MVKTKRETEKDKTYRKGKSKRVELLREDYPPEKIADYCKLEYV